MKVDTARMESSRLKQAVRNSLARFFSTCLASTPRLSSVANANPTSAPVPAGLLDLPFFATSRTAPLERPSAVCRWRTNGAEAEG